MSMTTVCQHLKVAEDLAFSRPWECLQNIGVRVMTTKSMRAQYCWLRNDIQTYTSDKRVSGGNWVMFKSFFECCWHWIFIIWHIVFSILGSVLELCDCLQNGMTSQIDNMRKTPINWGHGMLIHHNCITQFACTLFDNQNSWTWYLSVLTVAQGGT